MATPRIDYPNKGDLRGIYINDMYQNHLPLASKTRLRSQPVDFPHGRRRIRQQEGLAKILYFPRLFRSGHCFWAQHVAPHADSACQRRGLLEVSPGGGGQFHQNACVPTSAQGWLGFFGSGNPP